MRAFIAIELSGEMEKELASLQRGLKEASADVKWVDPKNIHLTLKFLGDVREDRIELIKDILQKIAAPEPSFEISLFKPGAFPGLDSPRVIWVGIDKGCAEAESLAKKIEDSLARIGFDKEKRPFSAHLTLGRVRSNKNKEKLKNRLLSAGVGPLAARVLSITLFQSTLTPKGPIYTPVQRFKLTS